MPAFNASGGANATKKLMKRLFLCADRRGRDEKPGQKRRFLLKNELQKTGCGAGWLAGAAGCFFEYGRVAE